MRMGAPIFVKTDDPYEQAKAHADKGLRAAYCRLGNNAPPEKAGVEVVC